MISLLSVGPVRLLQQIDLGLGCHSYAAAAAQIE
jgi:hypothetical protein